jgi:hypothetical protein
MSVTVKQPPHARIRKRKRTRDRIHVETGFTKDQSNARDGATYPQSNKSPPAQKQRRTPWTQHSTCYTLHFTLYTPPSHPRTQDDDHQEPETPRTNPTSHPRTQYATQAPKTLSTSPPDPIPSKSPRNTNRRPRTSRPVPRNPDRRHEPHCVNPTARARGRLCTNKLPLRRGGVGHRQRTATQMGERRRG